MLFSVIVPIYNVEKYLHECVNSILVQDFTNYELILVDDGSTDGSSLICDEYKKAGDRITVIHKENGGLSDARNTGLDIASGEYVWFMDSDDWLIDKSAFGVVAHIIETKNVDVVVYSYKKYFEQAGRYSRSIINSVSEDADIGKLIRTNAYKSLACNKVVRRSLIEENHMRFPLSRLGEDLVWCADLLVLSINGIALCDRDLMAYRQHEGSITGNKNQIFRERHLVDTLYLIDEVIKKHKVDAGCNDSDNLVAHFLAYEYSWLLGLAFPFWGKYGTRIKELEFLLDYALSEKVMKVNWLKRFAGLMRTARVLNLFIRIKRKAENRLGLCLYI